MSDLHHQVAQAVAERFAQLPDVEAIAVGGSIATGRATATSDIDIYIFPTSYLPPETRLSIGQEFSKDAEISDYWGPATVWVDPKTGIEVEALFFGVGWMEELVLQPLEQYQARMGFTTCFWHTIKISQVLYDRVGWLRRLKEKADQPYPEPLAQAIIDLNYPLLRDIYYSYRTQIASAIKRKDVYVMHKNVSAFLASYFDILFALNRMPHPGVKRMMDILEAECEIYPPDMRDHVTQLLKSSGSSMKKTVTTVDKLVDGLDLLLKK